MAIIQGQYQKNLLGLAPIAFALKRNVLLSWLQELNVKGIFEAYRPSLAQFQSC